MYGIFEYRNGQLAGTLFVGKCLLYLLLSPQHFVPSEARLVFRFSNYSDGHLELPRGEGDVWANPSFNY